MKWKGQILSGAIITGFMRWMEKKQSSIGILFRRLFTEKNTGLRILRTKPLSRCIP